MFEEWKKEHDSAIFSYAFISADKELSSDWQIGFYDKKQDKITTFSIINSKVADHRTDKVFKQPGSKMLEIEMSQVKLNVGDILKSVDEFMKKEYSAEVVNRKILILQNLAEFGTVWNITLITLNFNSVNIKVDAATGKVKAHKLTSLREFTSGKPS